MTLFWKIVQMWLVFHFGAISMGLAAYHSLYNNAGLLYYLVPASTLFLYASYYVAWVLTPIMITIMLYTWLRKDSRNEKVRT